MSFGALTETTLFLSWLTVLIADSPRSAISSLLHQAFAASLATRDRLGGEHRDRRRPRNASRNVIEFRTVSHMRNEVH